jgi:hypothetical protein
VKGSAKGATKGPASEKTEAEKPKTPKGPAK